MTVRVNKRMARFANDSVTVMNGVDESGVSVYLSKGGRRVLGGSSNPEGGSLERFLGVLYKSLLSLPKDPKHVPLPPRAWSFSPRPDHDKGLGSEGLVADSAMEAISSARGAGARRSAGSVETSVLSHYLLTSNGTVGRETSAKALLNVRAFTSKDASGHGLSCSSSARDFRPGEAGRTAGEHAKRMANAKQPEEGEYSVLMNPTVAANLLSLLGEFASAFSVEAGTSCLTGKVGKKVASEEVTLIDHGKTPGCLEGRTFDDEGQPTQSTTVIGKGILKGYLHNISTAKRFKTKTTGNAGIIDPGPWNLEVAAGDSTYEEMVSEMKKGVVLTSNWYTRFKNMRTGEFSTVPRDGAYLVEGGKVKGPLRGMRLTDTLGRMFSSVRMLSKEREWVQWWEVDTPTKCPWVLADGVSISRAYGGAP